MSRVLRNPLAGKTGIELEFVKLIHELTVLGRLRHDQVFGDFLETAYCAIAQQTTIDPNRWDELDERYMRIARARPAEYLRAMPELFGMLQLAFRRGDQGDFLGRLAGEFGALDEAGLDQFFTPFAISQAIAQVTLPAESVRQTIAEKGYVHILEPASGAGGMLLAAADVLDAIDGIDLGRHVVATAVDLSDTAFKMTFLQLACRGVPARVIRGNSLEQEALETVVTPAFLHFHVFHPEFPRENRTASTAAPAPAPAPAMPSDVVMPSARQLSLFGGAA